MNCQHFTSFIVEVARGGLMEAAAREGATRHVETCAPCAARLAQERNLTAALHTVGLSMSDRSAPARLEAQLLAAFHEHREHSNTATENPPTPLQASGASMAQPLNRWSRRVAVAAIAASLLLAAFLASWTQFTQIPPPREMAMKEPPGDTQSQPDGAATSSPISQLAMSNQSDGQERRGSAAAQVRRNTPPRVAPQVARAASPKMITTEQVIDGGNAIIEPDAGEVVSNAADSARPPDEPERVTDFIPLAGAPAPPLESGQLVRVQLPRSALASLGLPVNVERANEPVKADVLLGNDGLARAIRFVH